MSRLVPDHARSWIVVLAALAILLPACGRGRKKYLEQVTPLVEQNDMIDARFAELPKINAFKNPDYLPKLDGYIASKQALLNQMEAVQPPFLMTTTHAKLVQAMKNGIRYLQSEREKFIIAVQKISQIPQSQADDGFEIAREYLSQTAALQADMKEQLMKEQYRKLYDEVKDELERARRF